MNTRQLGAIAAVVAVLTIGGCGTQQTESAANAGRAETKPRPVADADRPDPTCPERAGKHGDPKHTGDGELVPTGATVATLCQTPASHDPERSKDPTKPLGTLDRDVERLVSSLNHLPAYGHDPGRACTLELGPRYDLVLGYPDGRQITLTIDGSSCGHVRYGDEYRDGGPDVVREFHDLLGSDPSGGGNGARPMRLACPEPSGGPDPLPELTRGTGSLVEMAPEPVAIRACPAELSGGGQDPLTEVVFEGWRAIKLADMLNTFQPGERPRGCRDDLGPLYDLVLAYPDGGRIVVRLETYGCGTVQIGDQYWFGGRDFDEYLTTLAQAD